MLDSAATGFAVGLAVNLILLGSSISLGVTLTFRLTPAAPARARYVIAVMAFFAAALLPAAATWHASRAALPVVDATGARAAEVSSAAPAPPDHAVRVSPPETHAARAASPSTTDFPPTPPRPNLFGSLNESVRLMARSVWAAVFLVVWVAVSLALLAREAAGHARLALLRRAWRPAGGLIRLKMRWPKDIPLYVDRRAGPCAVGLLSRAAVIPERMCDELSPLAARLIARHELSHLRWRDPLFNTLLRVTRALLWPSLPLWYLERVARSERESAADNAAVSGRQAPGDGNERVLEYAASLLLIAGWSAREAGRRPYGSIVTVVGNNALLEDRVRRLLLPPSPLTATRTCFAGVVFIVCAALTAHLPVASQPLRPAAELTAANQSGESGGTGAGYETGDLISGLADKLKDSGSSRDTFASLSRGLSPVTSYVTGGTQLRPARVSGPPPPREGVNVLAGTASGAGAGSTVNQDAQTGGQTVPQNFEAPPNFLREGMASVGYSNLSDEELSAIRRANVSHFYVLELAAVGYANLPLRTLIRLRENDVSAAYVKELRAHGYDNLSPDMLADFHWHGVSSKYIREVADLGYGSLSAKMILAFRRNSISPAYIKEMRALVKGKISGDDLVDMKWLGVSRDFINGLTLLGYENLTADQLTGMKQHGVTPAFIQTIRARNSKDYSADDLISMRMNGVR